MQRKSSVSHYGLHIGHAFTQQRLAAFISGATLILLLAHFFFIYQGVVVLAETQKLALETGDIHKEAMYLENSMVATYNNASAISHIVTENTEHVTVSVTADHL